MSSDDLSSSDHPATNTVLPPLARIGALQRQNRARKQNSGSHGNTNRKHKLQDRLQSIIVFELPAEGGREYQTMTLRGLYNYVMKSITNCPGPTSTSNLMKGASNSSISNRKQLAPVSPMHRARPTICRSSSGSPTLPPPPLFGGSGNRQQDTHTRTNSEMTSSSTTTVPTTSTASAVATAPMTSMSSAASLSSVLVGPGNLPPAPLPPPIIGPNAVLPSTENRVSFLTDGAAIPPPTAPLGRRTVSAGGSCSDEALVQQDSEEDEGGSKIEQPTITTTVTYRERLGGYLHPRDMRRLVTPFSSSNAPELMVRRHVMLLNFDPLRAIVLRDRLLIIVPQGADSILNTLEKRLRGGLGEVENEVFGSEEELEEESGEGNESAPVSVTTLPVMPLASPWETIDTTADIAGGEVKIEQPPNLAKSEISKEDNKVRPDGSFKNEDNAKDKDVGKITSVESKDSSSSASTEAVDEFDDDGDNDDEWIDIDKRNWIDMAFELQAVDAVLSSVCMMLSDDAMELRRKVYVAMDALRGTSRTSTPGEHAQEKLRLLKDKVGEMEARVQGFVRAMNLILDEDEDMALMNLSRLLTHPERFIQPVSQEILEEESDEPELILEAYLQESLSTVNSLELLKGNIVSTEELVNMMLDTVRNRLLYINTIISLASLCVATGSFVGSIFGMNLVNGFEDNEDTFWQVVMGTILGSLALLCLLAVLFNRALMFSQAKYK